MLMHMKVLNEGSTYRGKMKTLCGRMVQHHYRQTLSPSEFTGGNQLELYGIVKRKLEVLLGPKSKFHMRKKESPAVCVSISDILFLVNLNMYRRNPLT